MWQTLAVCNLHPPETNIAPENRPLEKEIPIGNHHFQGRTVTFREGILIYQPQNHGAMWSCDPHWFNLRWRRDWGREVLAQKISRPDLPALLGDAPPSLSHCHSKRYVILQLLFPRENLCVSSRCVFFQMVLGHLMRKRISWPGWMKILR